MINYIEKGRFLHIEINNAGYKLKANTNDEAYDLNGNQSAEIDNAVQAIINSFDPLPKTQEKAIEAIAQHANDLIDKNLSPIKQKRIQADAVNATIKKAKGAIPQSEQDKLDRYEVAIIYPDKIFAQYDVEEAAILAATDWTLINVEAAKANLDAIV